MYCIYIIRSKWDHPVALKNKAAYQIIPIRKYKIESRNHVPLCKQQ